MNNTDVLMLDLFGKLGIISDMVDRDYDANVNLVKRTTEGIDNLFKEADDISIDNFGSIDRMYPNLLDKGNFERAMNDDFFMKSFFKYLFPSLHYVGLESISRFSDSCVLYRFDVADSDKKQGTLDILGYDGEFMSKEAFSFAMEQAKNSVNTRKSGIRILLSIVPLDENFCGAAIISEAAPDKYYNKNICFNLNGSRGSEKYQALHKFFTTGEPSDDDMMRNMAKFLSIFGY